MQPQIRNADHLNGTDAVRELMRQQFPAPGAANGLVVLDIDMVLRVYGPNFGTDGEGRFILTEWKQGTANLSGGQLFTFKTIHKLMRRGDDAGRYLGFWKINYSNASNGDDDRFNPECVTIHKAVRLWDESPLVIEGHDAVCQFLSTLSVDDEGGAA
jgi:hypothetical protein